MKGVIRFSFSRGTESIVGRDESVPWGTEAFWERSGQTREGTESIVGRDKISHVGEMKRSGTGQVRRVDALKVLWVEMKSVMLGNEALWDVSGQTRGGTEALWVVMK